LKTEDPFQTKDVDWRPEQHLPPSRTKRRKRRKNVRRIVLAVTLVVLVAVVGFMSSVYFYVRGQFDRIATVSKPVADATHLLSVPAPGKPAISLIIGTDRRLTENDFGRSDTLMLVRVDSAAKVISTMSIPRGTQVDLPGFGPNLINAAYSYGGPSLALQTVEQVTGLRVNYLVVVGFTGFKDVIDAFGGLYVDVDHRYLYDGPQGAQGYNPINLQPGYQRLNGAQALAFARDRHADSDYFRIARQQLVIHELRRLAGELGGSTYHLFVHFSKVLSLVKAVAGSTDVGAAGGKLKFSTALHWVETIRGIPENRVITVPVEGSGSDSLQASIQQFLNPVTLVPKLPQIRLGPKSSATPGSGGGVAGTLANASVIPEPDYARDAFREEAARAAFPVLYPTVREIDSNLLDPIRVYPIETGHGRASALRATFDAGDGLNYWGIEETTWTDPPILEDPSRVQTYQGRQYRLYFNGGRLHMVAFQQADSVYWVSNSLFDTLSNATMIAIARSLRAVR
jgi:LCP family protein required for cell wall assembly